MKSLMFQTEIPAELEAHLTESLKTPFINYLLDNEIIYKIVNESGVKLYLSQKLHDCFGMVRRAPSGDYELLLSKELDSLPPYVKAYTFWHELYHVIRKDVLIAERLYKEGDHTRAAAHNIVAECLVRWNLGNLDTITNIVLYGEEYDEYGWKSIREKLPDVWKTNHCPPPEQMFIDLVLELIQKNEKMREDAIQDFLKKMENMEAEGMGSGENDISEAARGVKARSALDLLSSEIRSVFVTEAKGIEHAEIPRLPEYCRHIISFLGRKHKVTIPYAKKRSWDKPSRREKANDLPKNIFMQGMKRGTTPCIGFCLDTSISMPESKLYEAFSAVKHFTQSKHWQLRVVCGDTHVVYNEVIRPGDSSKIHEALKGKLGRGGTNLNPVFNACIEDPNVKALVFFTDNGTNRPDMTDANTLFVFNGTAPSWAREDHYIEI